jgi:hypothetical protein
MATYNNPEQLRQAAYGPLVEKTAAVAASGASDDLFSVDGGAVLITHLYGVVETVLVADTDLSIEFDPDDGGSDVTLASTLIADSDPTGTTYTLNGTFGGALVAGLDAQDGDAGGSVFIADSGDIKLSSAGGGAGGGSIHWHLIFVPLETGAVVTAAA